MYLPSGIALTIIFNPGGYKTVWSLLRAYTLVYGDVLLMGPSRLYTRETEGGGLPLHLQNKKISLAQSHVNEDA